MTFKLTATLTYKGWGDPIVKELYYVGDTFDDILAQIETLPQHLHNLKHYRRASFKDVRGVKHSWELTEMEGLN